MLKTARAINRVLLVDPPSALKRHHCPSHGLAYIRSALRRAGFAVEPLNLIKSREPARDLVRALDRIDAVGFTVNVASGTSVRMLGDAVRGSGAGIPILVGGPLATVAPERLVPAHADWAVIGEGEETAVELLRRGSPVGVQGTAYLDPESGRLRTNPPRPGISRLDALPFPEWLEADTRSYYLNSGNRNPLAGLLTSRGCPFDCLNCTKQVFGHGFRARSVENVLHEVRYLERKYSIRECFIWDDAFNIDPERAKSILEGLARMRTGIRFAFPNAFRADLADEEFFRLMKAAGVYWTAIAVESFSQPVLDRIGKGIKLQSALDAVKWCNKYGINSTAYLMLGLPGDTPETLEHTVREAVKLSVDQIMFFIATPFPGTGFHELAAREGRFLHDPLDSDVHFEGGVALHELPGLPAAAVEDAYVRANRGFYFNPRTALRFIRKRVRSPRDAVYLARNAWNMALHRRLW